MITANDNKQEYKEVKQDFEALKKLQIDNIITPQMQMENNCFMSILPEWYNNLSPSNYDKIIEKIQEEQLNTLYSKSRMPIKPYNENKYANIFHILSLYCPKPVLLPEDTDIAQKLVTVEDYNDITVNKIIRRNYIMLYYMLSTYHADEQAIKNAAQNTLFTFYGGKIPMLVNLNITTDMIYNYLTLQGK
jgi:hypothetical protein